MWIKWKNYLVYRSREICWCNFCKISYTRYGNVVMEVNVIFTVFVDVNKSFTLCRVPWIEFRRALNVIMKLEISIALMLRRNSVLLCTTRSSMKANRINRTFTDQHWWTRCWFTGRTDVGKTHTQAHTHTGIIYETSHFKLFGFY